MRTILAVIGGIIGGLLAMAAISFIGGLLYPLPVDLTIADPLRQTAEAFPDAPLGAQIFIAIAWLGGGFVGALIARWISGRVGIAWLVAGLVALVSVANIFVLPFPAWMQVATLVMPLLGALLANHVPLSPRARDEGAAADG